VRSDAIQPAIDEIFEEHAAYYLLGYETTNGVPDGKFRKVEVKVKTPGARARTRSGYWAPRADAIVNPRNDVAPVTQELNFTGMFSPHGLSLRALAVPVGPAGAGRDVDVAVVLTVRLPPLRTRVEETLTLTRHVYDGEGEPGPPVQEDVRMTLEPVPGDEHRYDVVRSLTLAPGRYQLRLNAHSRALDRNGSVYADVEVPDLSRQPLGASGIVLGGAEEPDPATVERLRGWVPVAPTTSRDFTSNDRITAFMRVHQAGAAPVPVTVEAQVFDRFDKAVFSESGTLEPERFEAGRGAPYRIALPLEALQGGPYLLSLTARAGSRSVRRDMVFRVR
jgi:hypothetical protein